MDNQVGNITGGEIMMGYAARKPSPGWTRKQQLGILF
jgi:hypothetical protein